jgi:predicted flap endonuclease-1-like 5' DNA nuclease
MMNEENGALRCAIGCWSMGAFFGFIAMMMLAVLGEFSWPGAVFSGGLVFVVAGLGLSAVLCRPLPRMSQFGSTQKNYWPHNVPAGHAPVPEPAPVVRPVAAAATVHVAAPAERPVAPDGKPEMLAAARNGQPDDLKEIKGVGPKLEQLLHSLGVFHFEQIASWRAAEVAWVDENLEGFKGRVTRDQWVDQARLLAAGGETEHSLAVQRGEAT